jgi:hypothetical protein
MLPILADFGISTVLSIIAILSSVTMMIIAHNQQVNEAEEGSAMGLKNNRADPGDPSPLPAGAPRWKPPLLAREVVLFDTADGAVTLNQFNGTNMRPRNLLILDTGVGPMDGGDLNVWLDKTAAFEVVNSVTNPHAREMLPDTRYATRTNFWFAKPSVREAGAEVYLHTAAQPAGYLYALGRDTDFSKYPTRTIAGIVGTKYYTNSAGKLVPTMKNDDRWNPHETVFNVKLEKLSQFNQQGTGEYKYVKCSLENGLVQYTSIVTNPGTTTFGGGWNVNNETRENLWALSDSLEGGWWASSWGSTGDTYKRQWKMQSVTVTTTGPDVDQLFDVVTNRGSLVSHAVFPEPVPAGTLRGHYHSLPFGDEAKLEVKHSMGELDQEPFPTTLLGGSAQTIVAKKEVTFTTTTTYDTSVPVQNMLLLFSSGNGGFWNMKKNGPDWYTGYIKIEVKAESAPDQPAATTGPLAADPQRGWVTLIYNGKDVLPLSAKVQNGFARWQFRVSDGIDGAKRKANSNWPIGGHRLIQSDYQIKISRTDVVEPDHDGARELFLEAVTEQTFQNYSFPMRSIMSIQYDESAGLKSEPEVEVQFRARKCRQVISFDALGNPVFRRAWTRNPVWIACEFITDRLTGGGIGGHHDGTINWLSAWQAANYCDEQVKWNGTTATRAECDYVAVKQKNLFRVLTDILGGSGVSPSFSRGKWFFPVDDDVREPVTDPLTGLDWTLSDADILDMEDNAKQDGIVFERKTIEQTTTDLHITFPDEANEFDKNVDPIYIPLAAEDILIRHIRKIDFPSVRRRWQAERAGTRVKEDEENNYRFATIRLNNLRTLALDPGDVFVLDCPSAQIPTGQKAMIIERTPGGENGRMEQRVLLLGKLKAQASPASPRTSGGTAVGGFQPNGGVTPGTRTPTDFTARSYIMKVEEL